MTNHGKGKVFEEDPKFDSDLLEMQIAWKSGKTASTPVEKSAISKILSAGDTRKAAKAVVALKTNKSRAGTDISEEQKKKILLAAGPTILNDAEQLIREFSAMANASMSQSLWKTKMARHQPAVKTLKQFDGHYDDVGIAGPISAACALGDFALSCKKAPSPKFVTGTFSSSRISKLLTRADDTQQIQFWAGEYLLTCLNQIKDVDKKAESIVSVLEATTRIHNPTEFRIAFLGDIMDGLTHFNEGTSTFTSLGTKVSEKLQAHKTLHDEFYDVLEVLLAEEHEEHEEVEEQEEAPEHATTNEGTVMGPLARHSEFQEEPEEAEEQQEEPRESADAEEDADAQETPEEEVDFFGGRRLSEDPEPFLGEPEEETEAGPEALETEDPAEREAEAEHEPSAEAESEEPEPEEQEVEPADLINIYGIGNVAREELESIEWKPVEEEPEPETEEVEETEEIAESLEVPEAKIFSVLDEAKGHLDDIASDELAMNERTLAVYELLKLLEIDEKSPQKLVLELAALAHDPSFTLPPKAVSALLSLPHVSDHNWSPRRDSSLLVSVIAAAPQDRSNDAIGEKLLYGSETEKDYAIDVLAERQRIYNDEQVNFSATPQELALNELRSHAITQAEYDLLYRQILAFSDMGVPNETLFSHLETAMEVDSERVEGVLLTTLNDYRAQNPGSVFQSSSEEHYTKEEAALAEDFLHYIGRGDETQRELSIAAAISNMDSPAAAEFALQRLQDSTEEDHTTAWAVVLAQSKAWETDKMIMDLSSSFEPEKQAAAITALAGRELTTRNAEFILEKSHSKNIPVATASGRALVEMDLSQIPPENEFAILYGMRNHPSEFLSDLAKDRLEHFLSESEAIPAPENIMDLSNLHLHDSDEVIRELAKECLMANPMDHLINIDTKHLLSSLGEETTPPILSMYEIARQMRIGDVDSKAVSSAVAKFEQENDHIALAQLMTAAHASGEKEYAKRVLVPCLGMDEIVSQMAGEYLLSLDELGLEVIQEAVKRENHPEGSPRERMKRISDKSLKLLLGTNNYEALVPLLGNINREVRASVYDVLEFAPSSTEKTRAVLGALYSENKTVRLAALNLMPKQETYLDKVIGCVEDKEKEISLRAAEITASLMSPEKLIVFLAHDHDSELVRQRVADAILQNHPEKLDELSDHLEKEDAILLADRQTILSTLRFFQHPKSLHQFFKFRDEGAEADRATIDNALGYFCKTLSGAMSAKTEEPTEEDMYLLLEAYKWFEQDDVRDSILAAAEGPSSEIMLNAALNSKDPDLLLSATDIFLSVANVNYAVQAARELRKTGLNEVNLPLVKPYQQILFGSQLNRMEEIVSPVENPDADPIPYRFLKEMVMSEFLNGRGSNESAELFMEFVGTFNDLEGFFDHGLESISELIWASRNEGVDYDAARKLPDRMPPNLVAEAQMLLDVLLLGKHDLLDKIKPSTGLKNLLVEHGLRRAVEALEGNWLKPDSEKENSMKSLVLLAELMERGMVDEKEINPLAYPHHPIVSALGAATEYWDGETVKEGLGMLEEVRTEIREANSTVRKLRKMRAELGPMGSDEVSPGEARADASKVARSKVPPPARQEGQPVQPKRPERGPSSIPPKN
ncbi:MAG: hypothetical protein GY852_05760 [bacterium]|nr:hypothetical protein [bacterium]